MGARSALRGALMAREGARPLVACPRCIGAGRRSCCRFIHDKNWIVAGAGGTSDANAAGPSLCESRADEAGSDAPPSEKRKPGAPQSEPGPDAVPFRQGPGDSAAAGTAAESAAAPRPRVALAEARGVSVTRLRSGRTQSGRSSARLGTQPRLKTSPPQDRQHPRTTSTRRARRPDRRGPVATRAAPGRAAGASGPEPPPARPSSSA